MKFRMLKKEGKGRPFPYTEALYARGDMMIVEMTKDEILGVKTKAKEEPQPEEFIAKCGKPCKNLAGKRAHERTCEKCIAIGD